MSAVALPDAGSIKIFFESLFQPNNLHDVFIAKFTTATSKGVDRINGAQYVGRAANDLEIVSRKCLGSTFRFSPYLEILKAKGRGKVPRLISIPTVRDRIVLHQLNKLLSFVYPECIPKNVASKYVQDIAGELGRLSPTTTFVCGCDIKTFYDGIPLDRLTTLLQKNLKYEPAIGLVRHALSTPTVPKDSRRKDHSKYRVQRGVPQGLAISNILAALYLNEIDVAMKALDVAYFRYVDDVLIYGEEDKVRKAHKSLSARLKRRGLALHSMKSGKGQLGQLSDPFTYLGYSFEWPRITVRTSTIERLLHSLASKFTHYMHTKATRLKSEKHLNSDLISEIFLLELNEKISGAISSKRKYGWIAYFNQINDLTLLHKLDAVVRAMFLRMPDFNRTAPAGLKTFKRSFYEMKFHPNGGYVRNFDNYVTRAERWQFLVSRGLIGEADALTDTEINDHFDAYVKRQLSEMHADEGRMYG
jgi:RNA-directed DNA polymerase